MLLKHFFNSSFEALSGGSIGFPTLIIILVNNGKQYLNLTNLCELTIATGNNNFLFLNDKSAAPCLGLFTRPFFWRVPSIKIPMLLLFNNLSQAILICFYQPCLF